MSARAELAPGAFHVVPAAARGGRVISARYVYYALAVLTASSVLNALDRQIVSILAQSIKADLGLSDAQLGFLLGTAFAVFYSIVGIAIGRIADAVSRTRLMGAGIALWSAMTALGAASVGFASLAVARIGVGVGEATANPCSYSLICQYFPQRRRATAIATYLTGLYIGGAAAMLFGGAMLQHWGTACRAVPIAGACALPAWKAVLLVVGLPGLPLAVMIARLREPARPARAHIPFGRLVASELGAALPPFALISLSRSGGRDARLANLALIVALVVVAGLLILATGDVGQWASLALGGYVIISWGQVQKLRDPPLYRLTFGCPTFVATMMSGVLLATIMSSVSVWAAPYAMRVLHMSPIATGAALGLVVTVASSISVVLGGWINDRWKQRDPGAPIWISMASLIVLVPALIVMVTTSRPAVYIGGFAVFCFFTSSWAGAYAATAQDLVLSRMRGTAASAFALVNVVISFGLGPYITGKISTETGSLATGLVSLLALAPFCLALMLVSIRRLRRETLDGRLERAEAAGEPPLEPHAVTPS